MTESRLVVQAADDMDGATFAKHWRARHATPNRMGGGALDDPPFSVEDELVLRAYHTRLHNATYWRGRLGPGDPGHDHAS